MAEYRKVSATGEIEPKRLQQYVGGKPTRHVCSSCGKPGRFMYIKVHRDDATDLECPVCDAVKTIPRGTENMP